MAADVLYSSPASARRIRHDALAYRSSSPDFPSLIDLLAKKPKKPPLRSGSRAAPIPDDAPKTFTSATSLWRSEQANEMAEATTKKLGPESAKTASVIELSSDGEESRTPANLMTPAKAVDDTRCSPLKLSPTHDKPWKKFKSPVRGSQTVDNGSTASQAATLKETLAVSPQRPPRFKIPGRIAAPRPVQSSSANAEEDVPEVRPPSRKRDWTPPSEPRAVVPLSGSSDNQEIASPDAKNAASRPRKEIFKNLQIAYGCKDNPRLSRESLIGDAPVVKKKRKIEMVGFSRPPSARPRAVESSVKSKAAPKKPRTITDLATAPYVALPVATEAEDAATSGNSTFDSYIDTPRAPSNATSKDEEAPKVRAKVKRKAKSKKQPVVDPNKVLLSPRQALAQVTNQDFLFGTSSQLATEHSPTFLRDMHAAMQASNRAEDPSTSPNVENFNSKHRRRLWNAAARDAAGSLVEVEVIDLVDSPANPFRDGVDRDGVPAAQMPPPKKYLSLQLLSSSPLPPASFAAKMAFNVDLTSPYFQVDGRSHEEALQVVEALEAASKRAPANMTDSVAPDQKAASDTGITRPKYELYSDLQLTRELSSYGFKPIKKRDIMIATLDQCWRSNCARSLGSMSQTAPYSTAAGAAAHATFDDEEQPAVETEPVIVVQITKKGRSKVKSRVVAAPLANQDASPPVKKARGRPRKDAAATDAVTKPKVKAKKATASASASASLSASASASTLAAAAPTAAKRGRPKSAVAAPPLPPEVDPFDDSDADSDASAFAPLPPDPDDPGVGDVTIDSTTELGDDSLALESTTVSVIAGSGSLARPSAPAAEEDEVALFVAITRAVTSAPRGSGTGVGEDGDVGPSWHERILMYDPVILEDLASWLNAGQLTRVGWDGEVAPGLVKRWCESRSVCCLWRVSLRGRERRRV